MYEHGISTVMLSEAYGMVDDSPREPASRRRSPKPSSSPSTPRRSPSRSRSIRGAGGIRQRSSDSDHLLHRLAAHGPSRRRQLRGCRPQGACWRRAENMSARSAVRRRRVQLSARRSRPTRPAPGPEFSRWNCSASTTRPRPWPPATGLLQIRPTIPTWNFIIMPSTTTPRP